MPFHHIRMLFYYIPKRIFRQSFYFLPVVGIIIIRQVSLTEVKMDFLKRALIVTLAACVLLVGTLGCGCISVTFPSPSPTITPAPSQPDTAEAREAKAKLDAIDLDLFKEYVCSTGISYQLWIIDPANYGIDEVPMTLGSATVEEDDAWLNQCNTYKDRLSEVDYGLLSDSDKLNYEIISRFIDDEISLSGTEYFDEPLVPYTGLHSNMPMTMTYLPLDDKEDVEIYLALLNDFGRLFDEIIAFEQEKSKRGMFMTDSAANNVIESCTEFIQSGDDCFLIGTFDGAIDELDELTVPEKTQYKADNLKAVKEVVMPAYTRLADCIKALKGTSTNNNGLCAFDGGKEYFNNAIRIASCGNLDAEACYTLLDNCRVDLTTSMVRAITSSPKVLDQFTTVNYTLGSVDDNMNYLQQLIKNDYPALPDHDVDYMQVPDELADYVSPAAYLIPAVDDATHNTIILNPSSIANDNSLLLTLAHEGYPGHMYQYVYQRSLKSVGLFASVAPLTAYSEGWSQASEQYVYENCKFGKDLGTVVFTNNMLSSVILPAMVSIKVNYEGWTKQQVFDFLNDQNLGYDDYVDYLYNLSVDHPLYILEYALGYAQYSELFSQVKAKQGSVFNLKSFYTQYLSYGPAYYDMIKSRMLGD